MNRRWLHVGLAPSLISMAIAAVVMSACSTTEPAPVDTTPTDKKPVDTVVVPPPPPTVNSVTISGGPIEMAGPGGVRATLNLVGPAGKIYEAVAVDITATGPFTAVLEKANRAHFRVLSVSASGLGTGTVTVTAGGKSGSVDITAVSPTFRTVTASDGFGCGIALDDRAWCWGDNSAGQLGTPTPGVCNGSACQYGGIGSNATPLPVSGNHKFVQIAAEGTRCSTNFGTSSGTCGRTCALTAEGEAFCWGATSAGSATADVSDPVPRRVGIGLTFVSLAVRPPTGDYGGVAQNCGLASDGQAYCFTTASVTPIGGGLKFASLSLGRFHSCGVALDGDVYCWGSNARGNLGIGSVDAQQHPSPERAVATAKFSAVAVGDYSSCALATDGIVHCWGQGYDAAGGSPPPPCPGISTLCQTTPRPLEGVGDYTAISRDHFAAWLCALTSAGAVSCWTHYNRPPATVPVPEALRSISVGAVARPPFACGVSLSSQSAYCWLPNYQVSKWYGQ